MMRWPTCGNLRRSCSAAAYDGTAVAYKPRDGPACDIALHRLSPEKHSVSKPRRRVDQPYQGACGRQMICRPEFRKDRCLRNSTGTHDLESAPICAVIVNMWELVAAAAAGLNAGAGLYVAMAEHPAGLEAGPSTYWNFFPKVSTKAVALSTTLSLLTAGGAAAAYFSGKRCRQLL